MRFIKKILDKTPKIPIYITLIPKKIGKHFIPNLHLWSSVRFKPYCIRTIHFHNPFSTFPYIPRKASFQEKSFPVKVLDKTPKIPISITLILQKSEKHFIPNLHLWSSVRFKPYSIRAIHFHNPFSPFPCIPRKATLREKSFTANILDTIPNFYFPFR